MVDGWSQGWEDVGRRLEAAFKGVPWGRVPPGFELVGRRRAMRVVLRGRPEGAESDVHVKWSRPATLTDRVARLLRGAKGPREGRVLLQLAEAGVPVPRVVGSLVAPDLLVTQTVEGLSPLPTFQEAPRDLPAAVGRLLGRAYRAGLRHPDLHTANLGLVGDEVWLVDVGRARIAESDDRVRELARARHGIFGDATWPQRLRALRAFLECEPSRELIDEIEAEARRIRRHYAQGRDRRAARTGVHFVQLRPKPGVRIARRREGPDVPVAWLEKDPGGARPLKDGGRVVGLRHDGRSLVLKRYAAALPGRLPRPVRAFRLAAALGDRGVPVPKAWAAVVGKDGSGFLLSERVGDAGLERLPPLEPAVRRRLLERLGRLLRRMHDEEIGHRDLKAPNLLVGLDPPRIWIADLDGASIRRGPIPWERRAHELARLDASAKASRTDRLRVLDAYLRVHPRLPVDRRTFAERLEVSAARKRGR